MVGLGLDAGWCDRRVGVDDGWCDGGVRMMLGGVMVMWVG